jgi:UDP-2,3-diacylglucosamine pyrophosphatase LpxH
MGGKDAMLVIISDLHLSDGSTGETLSPGALELFANRLTELAYGASWRLDGGYRPIERIDLVLLGDVLDMIRSTRWLARANVRPWSDSQSPEYIDLVSRITSDILANNEAGLKVLRSLATDGVAIPPALRSSRPAASEHSQSVPVRIHYMVGNHDWFFHLPGPAYDALRQTLTQRMGLANRHDQPLPHDMTESDELLQAMRRHKVTARHGDLFDPLNFEGDRACGSLGDAVVIELVNRFALEVAANLSDELPAATILGLREIDNIRPELLIPVWIDGLLERTCVPATRKRVKKIWDRLADEFLALDFVRHHATASPFDLVHGLERALKFSKRLSVGWASAIAEWIHKLRGADSDSYYPHALAEQDFRNRRSKHIVYGHTHFAETVPLDASYAEGYVLEQAYFNSGTWRRVHCQTRLAPNEHEFIASETMTYLAFFQGDERKGRPFESWSGTLGHLPAEAVVRRIDSAHAAQTARAREAASELQISNIAHNTTERPAPKCEIPAQNDIVVDAGTILHGPHFTPKRNVGITLS